MSNPIQMTRLLGIDPGLRFTGFGVIDVHNHTMRYVSSGVIKVTGEALPERLRSLIDGIHEVIERYTPHESVIEKVFVNVNPQSTLLLGQARGAAISALVLKDLMVHEYTALQLKKAVVGHGKANKEQVQEMVARLLELPRKPQADAADALAAAICHAQNRSQLAMLAKSDVLGGLGKKGMRIKNGRLVAL
ncbi:crossover junction endodeoxyribonuclease RuvC [Hydromonas duriensis]|uniref:Crossover junction endodeoxyribonuclease RuvC n=1 Tax=Hydromonas duriensis TaxID=1527608 RepID=A0A4R6YBE3_9BURK|nr:crossover junction endodeoxyribonuclease RuvC [Hydromonas duriensis]TDR32966.1 Holliday junction endonuclease RuvC [Hydromonas duriensis]